MMKPELVEAADVPLWQTVAERINQWRSAIGSGEPSISEWEGIKNPLLSWGFGGVGSMGGLEPADDPNHEWIPFFFPYYPAEDRAGRQRALDISATFTHALYWLNSCSFEGDKQKPDAQLMLVSTMTSPRSCDFSVDASVEFRRWIMDTKILTFSNDVLEKAAAKAHNLFHPSLPLERPVISKTKFIRFSAERYALIVNHVGAENQGMTLDSVEVDTPVQQLILLRALSAFWAIYHRKK